jgi:hypothetical protein
MKVFESLTEANHQGYELYDRLPAGYLVRTALYDRWAFALVVCSSEDFMQRSSAHPLGDVRIPRKSVTRSTGSSSS